MSSAFEDLIRKLERRYRILSRESMTELYKLAMEILIAERNLEKKLEESKNAEEKKLIEERLKRIKLWRDRIIITYIARSLGTTLPFGGERPW
ncbi:hypothetical protein DRN63_03775 [Nanoarchaeota archaeon]|nr:MAG: hypothetical protein DRN63_03775 [Nanoarchaeota archaeon]